MYDIVSVPVLCTCVPIFLSICHMFLKKNKTKTDLWTKMIYSPLRVRQKAAKENKAKTSKTCRQDIDIYKKMLQMCCNVNFTFSQPYFFPRKLVMSRINVTVNHQNNPICLLKKEFSIMSDSVSCWSVSCGSIQANVRLAGTTGRASWNVYKGNFM